MMNAFPKKNRKGLAIVEIIIALAIIAVVALTAATVLSGAYLTLMKEKSITSTVLEAQKDAEHIINTQRASDTGYVVYSDCFVPNHKVRLKQFEITKGEQVFYSLVSKIHSVAEVLPRVQKISTKFEDGGKDISTDFYYPTSTLKVKGEFEMDATTMHNFMVNTVYWYISKPGYYIPSSIETVEYGEGRIPYFPADYELVTHTADQPYTDFSLAKYGGRHIVMEVVPATLRGVLGDKAHADSLYIHALSYTNNIYAHYDASCLDVSPEYYLLEEKRILKWKDITNHGRDGFIQGAGKLILVQSPADSENYAGHDVKFQNSARLQIAKPDPTDKTPKTIFIVRRGGSDTKTAGYKTLYEGSSKTGKAPIDTVEYASDYQLHVYSYDRWPIDASGNPIPLSVTPSSVEDGVINEVIVYSSKLNDGSDASNAALKLIKDYLQAKYNSNNKDVITEVLSVKDVLLTVKGGTEFRAPSEANAVLKDGRVVPVNVQWNAAQLTAATEAIKAGNATDKPIVKVVQGNIVNSPSKPVKMIITIPVGDSIALKLKDRVIAKGQKTKLKIAVETTDTDPEVEISFSKDGIVSVDNKKVKVVGETSVELKALKNGRIDVVVTYGTTTRKVQLVVTEEEPPTMNRVLWLDAMDAETLRLDAGGKVLEWKNKEGTDPKTNFTSIIADAPTYTSKYDTAYLEFSRGKNLKAEKLDGIDFRAPYNQSEIVIYFVGKLNDKTSPHALFSQSHKDTRLDYINLPAYVLKADMKEEEVEQAVYNESGDLEVKDDKDDDDSDEEDADTNVELNKKFVIYGSIRHRRDIEGAINHDFFDLTLGAGQGEDWLLPEEENFNVPSHEMYTADTSDFYIGKAMGGLTFDGRVYEVLIYKGIQDPTTTEKVLKYLKQKWYD